MPSAICQLELPSACLSTIPAAHPYVHPSSAVLPSSSNLKSARFSHAFAAWSLVHSQLHIYVHKQFPVIPKRSSSIKRWRNWDMLPVRNSILLQVTMETIKPLTQQRKNERSPSQPSCQITSRHCKVSISFSFKILKCLASKEMGQTSVTFTPPLALVWSHILYIHMYTYIYIYKWVAKYTRLCCTSLY